MFVLSKPNQKYTKLVQQNVDNITCCNPCQLEALNSLRVSLHQPPLVVSQEKICKRLKNRT